MTTAQLTNAFKNGGATKWSDIDPSWPAESIKFYYPGADSGTFDYFNEATKTAGRGEQGAAHRSDGTSSEDDNVLVQGVEGDKNAIGYFGFAYYLEAGKNLTGRRGRRWRGLRRAVVRHRARRHLHPAQPAALHLHRGDVPGGEAAGRSAS